MPFDRILLSNIKYTTKEIKSNFFIVNTTYCTLLMYVKPIINKYLKFTEAVPNTILKIMNVPGLTRENVASHLQVR